MNTFATPNIDTLTSLLESYDELRRLQHQLRSLWLRLEDARRYIATAGSNQSLGRAQFERMRERYSATLTGLRIARRDAYRRLGLTASADHPPIA